MILENNCKQGSKVAIFNRCVQLSVNVESTNRADFCGLRRKIAVNDARYLRDGWKTNRAGMRRQSHPALTTKEGSIPYGY